jgi:hypothetical protein
MIKPQWKRLGEIDPGLQGAAEEEEECMVQETRLAGPDRPDGDLGFNCVRERGGVGLPSRKRYCW